MRNVAKPKEPPKLSSKHGSWTAHTPGHPLAAHHAWCRVQNGHGTCDCAWLNQGTERSAHEWVIHRGGIAIKDYKVPSKTPRGFWHGDNPLDAIKWAWCPVVDGVMLTSQSRGGFASMDAAKADAFAKTGAATTAAAIAPTVMNLPPATVSPASLGAAVAGALGDAPPADV